MSDIRESRICIFLEILSYDLQQHRNVSLVSSIMQLSDVTAAVLWTTEHGYVDYGAGQVHHTITYKFSLTDIWDNAYMLSEID